MKHQGNYEKSESDEKFQEPDLVNPNDPLEEYYKRKKKKKKEINMPHKKS
ncbi:MAG: hypothetical protein Q7S27_05010 [Nanoarchaeota archaeon]|nr:hypothetical protein [Nanoarchaeota archaeon]